MLEFISAYEEDWNPATVEGYSKSQNKITLVFNFDIANEDKIEKAIQYVVGRTAWCCNNFPPETKVTLSFDFRGQNVIISKAREFKDLVISVIDPIIVENDVFINYLI